MFENFSAEETITHASLGPKPPPKAYLWPARSRRQPPVLNTATLQRQLSDAPHFGLLLEARVSFDTKIRVGRSKSSDVYLRHASVSSDHAIIDANHEDLYYLLTDNGSTNGTRLNGEKVAPQTEVGLYLGDVVHFGEVEVTLCPLTILRTVLVRMGMASTATL